MSNYIRRMNRAEHNRKRTIGIVATMMFVAGLLFGMALQAFISWNLDRCAVKADIGSPLSTAVLGP